MEPTLRCTPKHAERRLIMASWWSWLTGGSGGTPARGAQQTGSGPRVVPSDFARRPLAPMDTPTGQAARAAEAQSFVATAPRPGHGPGATVMVDDPVTGTHEIAEIKPLGVIAPRNKQELVEELRKSYTEVIDLVRKTNAHLDDQARRQSAQEQRQSQLVELTREMATSLAAIQQHNGLLLDALARLSLGQDRNTAAQGEIRDAIELGRQDASQTGRQLHESLEAIRSLTDQSHATQRESLAAVQAVQVASEASREAQATMDQTLRGVGSSLSSMHTATEQLVSISRSTSERAERLELFRGRTKWMAIAGLTLAALCVFGLFLIALLLRR